MDVDTEKQHTREIEQQLEKTSRELYNQQAGESDEQTLQRAMRDPEVAVSIYFNPHGAAQLIAVVVHYERPCHAVNSSASPTEPCCIAGPYEKPGCIQEDSKVGCSWYYQDPKIGPFALLKAAASSVQDISMDN